MQRYQVQQRIDPIARQQGSIYYTSNDPRQHLEMFSVIRQLALQKPALVRASTVVSVQIDHRPGGLNRILTGEERAVPALVLFISASSLLLLIMPAARFASVHLWGLGSSLASGLGSALASSFRISRSASSQS